ncbi:MAG: hypothetical protein KDN18_12515 [Verrucomicrobiae bacterium]|nr:hypothetical protein [Verrucomicrobiae bacterium]
MKPLISNPALPLRTFLRPIRALMLVLLALSLIGWVSAEPPKGRLLASQCFQCHGTNGQAVGGFESISGKSARELFEELSEMSKRRPEGIMDLQARGYTPDQLRQISEYLATLPRSGNDDNNGSLVEKVKTERKEQQAKKRNRLKARRERARSRKTRR